jgi:hypothetical protein
MKLILLIRFIYSQCRNQPLVGWIDGLSLVIEMKTFKPKTKLVKQLLLLRKKAIKKGMKLLSVDEILADKHSNR